jgi:hypothetical protein
MTPPVVFVLSPSWLVVELDAPPVELHLVRASWLDENGLEIAHVEVAEA